ncbi:hypothetical protein [Caenimonas aquaedulcis]|uniref:Uncharacterized protein n=1 Tax=Caenimonas aquaedulcis TaxID=2793270 RepID=A0A931MIR3_9BURK|nr:hypothetical protein [Caenimonas aquaedulcis]MBG9390287.1 hypothetical protein [Caenimonas aquaedulcis]
MDTQERTAAPAATVDSKLAKWSSLFEQLQAARKRVKDALAGGAGEVPGELSDEVLRLKRLSGAALDEVTEEYRRQKESVG